MIIFGIFVCALFLRLYGTAMGAGKSKKEAKHAAAKALIERLSDLSLYSNSQQQLQQQQHQQRQSGNDELATTNIHPDSCSENGFYDESK